MPDWIILLISATRRTHELYLLITEFVAYVTFFVFSWLILIYLFLQSPFLSLRLKKVVFSGKGSSESFASGSSTVDRKKKNFSFSRKFPFMKSKDQISGDETSDAEGVIAISFLIATNSSAHDSISLHRISSHPHLCGKNCFHYTNGHSFLILRSPGWYTPHYGLGITVCSLRIKCIKWFVGFCTRVHYLSTSQS